MMELGAFSLLRPFWLVALPVILALAVFLGRRRSGIGNWDKVIDPGLMKAMRAMGRVEAPSSAARHYLPFWAAGLIALALSGPAIEKREAQAFRNLDGVVFVMDVSSSVVQNPLWQQIVTIGRVGVSALGSKPAALIIYAGDAYVASALTTDTRQIGLTMSLLDENTVPDKGSRPALALDLATQMLAEAGIVAGDAVLISDGGGLGPDTLVAAKTLREQGARLSVIHVPTDESDADGTEQLQSLVSVGNGQLYALTDGNALAADISRNTWERIERQDYQLLFFADYGRYILLIALLPVLGLFRRGNL